MCFSTALAHKNSKGKYTWTIFMTSNTQIWISMSVQVSFLIINRGEFRFLVRSTLKVVFLISKVT